MVYQAPDPSITSEKDLSNDRSSVRTIGDLVCRTTLLQGLIHSPTHREYSPKFHDYFNRHSEDDAVKKVYIAQKKFLISRVSEGHDKVNRKIWLPEDRELQRVTELLGSLKLSGPQQRGP